MGIGEKDSQGIRRNVSIGFIQPDTLRDNAIYVQLRQRGGDFSAEAISEMPFNFMQKSIYGHDIYMKEKRADSARTGHNGLDFVEMIVQQNKGRREFRYLDDSYRMLGRI